MSKNIVIAILIVVFLAVVFFLDWPAFKQVSYLREEIRDYNKVIKEKEELAAKVEQLRSVYESRQIDIGKVYYVLPRSEEVPELIVQFEALASENGLILENLDIGEMKKEKKEKINALKVSLAVTGSYSSFKKFLEALEYNVRIMDIQNIEFNFKRSQEGANPLLEVNIDLRVYYQ